MADFKIPINKRVKLKGEAAQLYELAYVGSEGWVRKRKRDDIGFPMVFVEWDRDHWTYNGEPNHWTYEGHFETVEDDKVEVDREKAAAALAALQQAFGLDQPESTDDSVEQVESEPIESKNSEGYGLVDKEKYIEILTEASKIAAEGDSFLLMVVTRQDIPNHSEPALVPRAFSAYRNEETGLLLEAQVSAIAAQAHQDIAVDSIRRVLDKKDKDKSE